MHIAKRDLLWLAVAIVLAVAVWGVTYSYWRDRETRLVRRMRDLEIEYHQAVYGWDKER